jgi:putative endonuclease
MYYVYVLRLKDNHIYTGFTKDLSKRMVKHNAGDVSSTKKFLPAELIYYSSFGSKDRAIQFEKYLKTASGIAFRNKHLI